MKDFKIDKIAKDYIREIIYDFSLSNILSIEKLVNLVFGNYHKTYYDNKYECEIVSSLNVFNVYEQTILIIKEAKTEKQHCYTYDMVGCKFIHPLQPNNTTFMGNCSIDYINAFFLRNPSKYPVIMLSAPAYDNKGKMLNYIGLIPVFIPNKYAEIEVIYVS
jgi:hypothetical protein